MEPFANIALHFVRRRFRDDYIVTHDLDGVPITVGFLRGCFEWYYGADPWDVHTGDAQPEMPSDWMRGLFVKSNGEVFDEFGNCWTEGTSSEMPVAITRRAA